MNITSKLFAEGDLIGGDYVVQRILGRGGFGIVYLVRHQETGEVVALKTFRDEFLADPRVRDAFQREAHLWVRLDKHPFILEARWVKIFSGRIFVAMEHVAPDVNDRVSLSDYLQSGRPIEKQCAVEWAVQFCLGMEHANSHGIKCHRDIKPTNILISQGVLKISDFGLAAEVPLTTATIRNNPLDVRGVQRVGLGVYRTERGMRLGTPGYMPPEVYLGESADQRSDIYSLGLVLWQMAAGCESPPFVGEFRGDIEKFMQETFSQQIHRRLPRLDSPLHAVIERCLSPRPSDRYGSFHELRTALEPIMVMLTEKLITVHGTEFPTSGFWNDKGISLAALGRHEEAVTCYDKALAIEPRNAKIWSNKGVSLADLGHHEEAVGCYNKALTLDIRLAGLWANKGNSLGFLGHHEEAVASYDKALAIDPMDRNSWNSMGCALTALNRNDEAVGCFNSALVIDPRYAEAWNNKGSALYALGRAKEAIACYDEALIANPLYSEATNNRNLALSALKRHDNLEGPPSSEPGLNRR